MLHIPSRRGFLLGGIGLGLAGAAQAQPAKPYPNLGVQLYTVRDAFMADPLATLIKIKAMGFAEVEMAGLAGRSAREMRGFLDQAGLKARSCHIGYADWLNRPEAALDEAAELGMSYALLAWLIPDQRNNWSGLATKLNGWGDLAHARGLTVGYHNHDFEFAGSGHDLPFHILLESTDPSKVIFELDCYWASVAGHDPIHVLHEHGDRIKLLHLKDKAADGKMAPVGQGVIDYAELLTTAKSKGVAHVFVEHDNPVDAFASLQQSVSWLTKA